MEIQLCIIKKLCKLHTPIDDLCLTVGNHNYVEPCLPITIACQSL